MAKCGERKVQLTDKEFHKKSPTGGCVGRTRPPARDAGIGAGE